VRHGRYRLYNAVNKAGANRIREVRGPLLVEVLAARRRNSLIKSWRSDNIPGNSLILRGGLIIRNSLI
jgi:hypothetical protein